MAESPLILSLDVGPLAVRCTLFDANGHAIGSRTRRLFIVADGPARQEQDAGAVWQALVEAVAELGAQFSLASVAAVGLATQRDTCLLWDRASGEPLGPAIYWADRRTEPIIGALRDSGHALLVQSATGVELSSTHSAPKLRWMLDTLPGAGGLLAVGQLAGGTLDSWLLWKLTGGALHATDYSNAQRTLLLNLNTLQWSSELTRLFGVAPEILPEVWRGVGAWSSVKSATLPQLRAPIGAVAADQTAALAGRSAFAPGDAACSYDAAVTPLMFAGARPAGQRDGLALVAYDATGMPAYAMGRRISGGALALEWCCSRLGAFASIEELVAQAAIAPTDEDVVFVPAFAGLHTGDNASGHAAILGLRAESDRRSIARAALESIALQVADALALMHDASNIEPTRLSASGALANSDLLMQLQADLLGIPVERPAQHEPASLGIAYLAAIGAGLPIGEDFLDIGRGVVRTFTPQLDEGARARRLALWHAGVERAGGTHR